MRFISVLLLASFLVSFTPSHATEPSAPVHGFSTLVFSKTAGFRHNSIPDGIAAIQELGLSHDFSVEATEDASVFNDATLASYDVVIFLNTTGDVLTPDQQAAFERFIQGGGGFVGVHSAADTEYNWPFYGDLIGAYFASHPQIQTATVKVVDQVHPSTEGLPARWERTDEWYNFQTNPRGEVHVLATLDEDTYTGGTMGHDHPIAWCHSYEGGRSWYTAGGHTAESFAEPLFREHLLNGLEWAAGAVSGDCGATVGGNIEKVILDNDVQNPLDLDVAPDGRVFFIELGGALKVYNPQTARTEVAARLAVEAVNEDGLIGIALDPDFAQTGYIYLTYSPRGTSVNRVSRFRVAGSTLDLASEATLLEYAVVRNACCHSGGAMTFDADGNLFIATGDDTNPFATGYAPLDEQPGREPWDAQRSSANTQDLNGKILRITPQPDGSYTVPQGNLFDNPADGRPEIYVMGVRNPYRISVDPATNWLYWGDVGPDAGASDPARGPQGLDEWNQAREAGNYGWPYCLGPNLAYRDYNFATGTSGAAFDCAAPVNDSPNNTGPRQLPPAQPAWIWYPYGPSDAFPAIANGEGRTAMAGPVYHFDNDLESDRKLPAYYDNTFFIFEWARNDFYEVKLDAAGDLLAIQPFVPDLPFQRPISMRLGPEGALYVIEWGNGFGGNNPDAQLVRLDYRRGQRAPVAVIEASVTAGPLPLQVDFSALNSFDPDPGDVLSYAWDFDGDGTEDATGATVSHTYTTAGSFLAGLTVTDPQGLSATANTRITAGNSAPSVTMTLPADGGFYDWGDAVPFAVGASDPEDGSTAAGTIDCAALQVQTFIGHDEHSHPLDLLNTCDGVFQTAEGHGDDADNVFQLIEVSYTDAGGASALTARTQHLIRPKRLEAEHFAANEGSILERTGDIAGGGQNLGFLDHGDYVVFTPMNLHGIEFVTYRVASAGVGGRIEVRVDAPNGPTISTAYVEPTGQWQVYREVTTPIDDPGGTHTLYFVFLRNPGDTGLFNVNWMDFHGQGIAAEDERGREGLTAVYFSELDFRGRRSERIDPRINFNWAEGGPISFFSGNAFSARWTGQIEAPRADTYTFFARSSDGMRMWLEGQLILDQWVDQDVRETASTPVRLEAGQRYPIRVEYYEQTGEAQAHLSWSSRFMPKEIVPAHALYPTDGPTARDETPQQPRLLLAPVYPNPVSRSATIRVTLPEPGEARVEVYDVLGRRVAVLAESFASAGTHTVSLDGNVLADGLYICRLSTPAGTASQTFVVLK